jgi:uncharacterized protein (DUF1800 family)
MGNSKKQQAGGPTRRKVLATALAAGAGVAGARILGLRNLNASQAVDALDPMAAGMDPMGMYVTGMDDADGSLLVPDDSYFGSQNLDASVLPEQLKPGAPLPPVAAPRSVVSGPGKLLPPITGITAPRLAGDLDWISPLAAESAKVTHLLRRATFGYTEAELDRALSDGYAKTLDRLIETPFAQPPGFAARPAATPTPRPSPSASPSARPSGSASPAVASPVASPTTAPTIAPSPSMSSASPSISTASQAPAAPMLNNASINVQNLQVWWVDWMTQSPTPFAEKMTLFWHGHFTSDYRKVGTSSPAMYWQNLTWRKMAMGDLKSMLLQVTPDLAMLRYLDLAVSTGRAPNENYARELMELFTLGPGNFTEDDVKAAAKALAGWRLPMRTETTAMTGIFDPKRASTGPVTFLGKTAAFDAAGVVDQILAEDAAATFISREVARFFVSPAATDAYVARLADGFRRSRYDVKSLMRTVFTSPEFTAPESFRALIKSPTEFMVSTAKALAAPNVSRTIVGYGSMLGQNLFDPPSVGGWGDNASWISSNTMLQRANYASAVLGQMRTVPSAAKAHERHLDAVLGPGTVQELNNSRDDRSRWFAVLASPEFQLK